MSFLHVSVERYSLTVEAAETIRVMAESADNVWGRRLRDALTFATVAGSSAFAVPPYARVELADFRPGGPERPDMADVSARHVWDVLGNLQDAGYLTVRVLLNESTGASYLSEGRTVTPVEVHRPFALVGVEYRWSPEAEYRVIRYGSSFADRWEITDRSYIVPAGWYLVGEVGDYSTELVAVAGMDGDPEGWLFELDGFGASQCLAVCGSCGARWTASDGSRHFVPDGDDVCAWDFDDAEDHDHGTITCPACGVGRVGFDIY